MTNTDALQLFQEHVSADRERIFTELSELVRFNSVHGDPALVDEANAAAGWVEKALQSHGLTVEAIDSSDGSRTIIGRRKGSAEAPTVLLYSHYDVVSAGDHAAWSADPFTLTERDGRWYARGAADCKGNLAMHLAALRAVDKAGGTGLNLIVLVEGSEENGGAGLDDLIARRPELFAADVILIADTGNAAVGVPTLTTGLRGGAQVSVTVDTLAGALHSGMFGGAAPDAVAALTRTLDSLRDDAGRTVIDGVDVTGSWDGAPYDAETFRADAGVLEGVSLLGGGDAPADLVWARPAVTVTGFTSTPVAEAVNAVPATASAQLNLRVPHGMDAADTAEKLVAHLKAHTPWGAHVEVEVADVNDAFATDTSQPAIALLGECLTEAYGAEELTEVGSGGSIPLTSALQAAYPEAQIALFGVEEPQAAIHSPDESVDPTEIERVAAAEAAFLLRYGRR